MRTCLILLSAACVLPWCTPVRAGEAYYVVVYASQRVPSNPNYSHTFATFVHACWPGEAACPGDATATLEAHTISWLSESGVVRTLACLPECGRNWGLHETIELALNTSQRVSLWGPYEVTPELYERAKKRKAQLESGGVRYKANDTGYPSDRVSNCIHGVAAAVDGRRLRVGSPGWGQVASYSVLRRMRPFILDREQTHDWLVQRLGLEVYPIYYREWGPPMSGAFLGPVYRAIGGELDLQPTYGPPPVRRRAGGEKGRSASTPAS